MLDYEVITAEDASERAEGWKKLGVRHIEKGEWDEATKCFKKAATFFGDAMDKENRKLMNSMVRDRERARPVSLSPPLSLFLPPSPFLPVSTSVTFCCERGRWVARMCGRRRRRRMEERNF
jgi:hypothetical protein